MRVNLITVLVAFGCAGLLTCSGAQADLAGSGPAKDIVVRRGSLMQELVLTGELRAVHADNIVVPRTPSWQVQIRWMEEDGAEVTAGQKVVEFDNSAFAGTLEEDKLALTKTEKELMQHQAQNEAQEAEKVFQLEQRRGELEKAKLDANVPQEFLSLRDYQDRQLALERAQVAFEKAQEDLEAFRKGTREDLAIRRIAREKASRKIRLAEQAIQALTLYAPRGGIFITTELPWEGRKLQEGDTVWAGLTVARIPDLSVMEVEASLSDVDDGKVHVGMQAACTLDAYPDLEFPGIVAEVTPIAQETSPRSLRRALRVTVALERSDPERMRPGMAVRAVVHTHHVPDALLAPRASLILEGNAPRAVLEDGSLVDVQLGPCDALECVVKEGFSVGTRLGSSTGRTQ